MYNMQIERALRNHPLTKGKDILIMYWNEPINVQWHRVIDCIWMKKEDEAYLATIELVRQSKKLGNTY